MGPAQYRVVFSIVAVFCCQETGRIVDLKARNFELLLDSLPLLKSECDHMHRG